MDGDVKSCSGLDGLSVEFDASAKPYFAVDVERYQAYLDDADMTDTQKEAFLQCMWQIIVGSHAEWILGLSGPCGLSI